jgi:hypothetical protein
MNRVRFGAAMGRAEAHFFFSLFREQIPRMFVSLEQRAATERGSVLGRAFPALIAPGFCSLTAASAGNTNWSAEGADGMRPSRLAGAEAGRQEKLVRRD